MLPIGTLLQDGKYRVVRYMASGGFGNTYEVEHVKLHKRLALKEFFMRGVNLREGLTVTVSVDDNRASFEQMREKFYKEAQRLAQLDELHIVEVSDFFEENATAYYTMRLIDGESLAATMKRSGQPMEESELTQMLPQVLSALRCVHSQGIYHLDIKPGNIMRNATGHCWLIDFGASKQLSAAESQTLSTSTGLCYTPGFAPSEQISGNIKRIGPWTDFYALGATLYNLLTDQMPPSPDDIMDDEEDAFDFTTKISPTMQQLILWLMSPRPRQRPQSVDDILNWDAESISGTSQETVVAATPQRSVAITKEPVVPQPEEPIATPAPKPKVVPSIETVVSEKTSQDKKPQQAITIKTTNEVLLNLINNMVTVEGGTYYDHSSGFWNSSEEVEVKGFSIGKFPVTQIEWQTVMGSNPSTFKGDNHPVEMVSWFDCQEFIKRLNQMTGMKFRLPNEQEWEFAARGGIYGQGMHYAGSDDPNDVAWYTKNSKNTTHDVGRKRPNELGIYDMSGNVWEWCEDAYEQGNPDSVRRVRRGGGWYCDNNAILVTSRDFFSPNGRINYLGLRLAI